jgi:two-component system, response regulator RegA
VRTALDRAPYSGAIADAAILAGVPRQARGAGAWAVALLLDADCSGRRRLARDLEARDFQVDVTDDAAEGHRLMLARRPALVVTELQLRAGHGIDLLAPARAALPDVRLVVLTSYGSVASAVRAMRLGASDYLCKPATAAEVLRADGAPARGGGDADAGFGVTPAPAPDAAGAPAPLTLDEAIWEYIHQTLEAAGSLSEAARRLGLYRQSLKRMITKYRPAGGAPATRAIHAA